MESIKKKERNSILVTGLKVLDMALESASMAYLK